MVGSLARDVIIIATMEGKSLMSIYLAFVQSHQLDIETWNKLMDA